jgi:hypothetical protein
MSGRTQPESLTRWQAVMSPIALSVMASAAMVKGTIIAGEKSKPP